MDGILSYQLLLDIFKLIEVIALAGTVILLTYATITAIVYIVFQDVALATGKGDQVEKFTGIEGHRTREGMMKIFIRFFSTCLLLAFIVGNFHILVLSKFYEYLLMFINAVL